MSERFVFDERFTEAFIHVTPPKIMGIQLQPFSYWHKVQLEYVQSKLLLGGAERWDLWVAAKVCSTQYPCNVQFKSKYSNLWWVGWFLSNFWRNFKKEYGLFLSYLNDYASPPKLWAGKGSSEKRLAAAYKSLGDVTGEASFYQKSAEWENEAEIVKGKGREIDDSIEQISIFMKFAGQSPKAAWNMAMGELLWYNVCLLKMEGSEATVWTPMDEEIFRQHTINREVKIGEAATALQVESPHLPREIALAQASVNYWNEVVENQRTAR